MRGGRLQASGPRAGRPAPGGGTRAVLAAPGVGGSFAKGPGRGRGHTACPGTERRSRGRGDPGTPPPDGRPELRGRPRGRPSPPTGAKPQRHTPTRGTAQPRARRFRGAAGPSPTMRGSPGAGPASGTHDPPRNPPASPGGRRAPPARRPAQGLGPGGLGSREARAGPLGAVRVGGGAGRGAPRAPAGRANGRPAFGKIAIYGHVLGPRAHPSPLK